MENKFNLQYFILKFQQIPNKMWGTGNLDSKCVLYHCGMREYNKPTEESKALTKLMFGEEWMDYKVWSINDTSGKKMGYPQNTPKERILAFLYELRDGKNAKSITIDSKLQEQEPILN